MASIGPVLARIKGRIVMLHHIDQLEVSLLALLFHITSVDIGGESWNGGGENWQFHFWLFGAVVVTDCSWYSSKLKFAVKYPCLGVISLSLPEGVVPPGWASRVLSCCFTYFTYNVGHVLCVQFDKRLRPELSRLLSPGHDHGLTLINN